MQSSGVITITTDFGHKGPFAAVMKGVILSRFPGAKIIDLAHDIPAQWPPEAGFWVSRSYSYFPRGSVHLAIVDPGVGTERDILIVEYDHHYFMAPDNGLLAQLLDSADDAAVFRLDLDALERLDIATPSNTFHGRDIFAPIAAELAAGRTTPVCIAKATQDWAPAWIDEPDVTSGKVAGVVVTVDTFGNLISNIDASLIESFKQPSVHIAGQDIEMKATYGRAQPGEYLALINSFGVLEIAKAESSAAEGLGIERGAPITVSDGTHT
jgi:S-adenosylmethionine hydrolase